MNKKCVFVILAAVALVLGACFSPWKGDEGTISIRISGKNDLAADKIDEKTAGRAADAFGLEEEDRGRLVHTIILSGPGPEQRQDNVKYGRTVDFSVTPGRWNISITASLGGGIYAKGSRSNVDIKPGPNPPIDIEMALVTYTVTFFDSNGGSVVDQKTNLKCGSHISVPENPPTKAGYDFAGWYTDPAATTTRAEFPITVIGDIDLYAGWTPKGEFTYCDVQFDINYSYSDTSLPAIPHPDNPVKAGSPIILPDLNLLSIYAKVTDDIILSDIIKEYGYLFNGWNTEADGTGTSYQAGKECIVNRDTILYAQWNSTVVAVTGVTLNKTNLNLTVGGNPETLTVTITPNNATIQDVTWASSNKDVATVNNDGIVTAVCEGSTTITVTALGGNNITATCTVTVNPAKPENKTPTKDNYDISGTGKVTYDGSAKIVTVTAKPDKSTGTVTVYYEGTGSTTYPKNTIPPSAAGTYAVTFDVAAKDDWNAASGLSAGTLTIEEVYYTVLFDINIHSIISSISDRSISYPDLVPADSEIKLPGLDQLIKYASLTDAFLLNNAIKIINDYGYLFGGWNTEKDGTGTLYQAGDSYTVNNDNTILHAKWNSPVIPENKTPTATDYDISGTGTFTYDGSPKIVTVTRISSDKSPGKVTVKYNDDTAAPSAAGTYTVTFDVAPAVADGWIAATGLSAGTLTISPKAASTLSIAISDQTYSGSAITPTVTVKDGATTLTLNTHYTVEYADNINAGPATVKVTGVGNYTGTTTKNFTIKPKAITFTIDAISDQTYSGSAITPKVIVKDGTTTLGKDDYTVSYSDNTNAGIATVTVTGVDNYKGSSGTATFTITKAATNTTITISPWVNEEDGTIQLTTDQGETPITISGTRTFKVNWKDIDDISRTLWYLGGSKIGTGPEITISAKNYNPGNYQLMIVVYKGSKPYSAEITVTIK